MDVREASGLRVVWLCLAVTAGVIWLMSSGNSCSAAPAWSRFQSNEWQFSVTAPGKLAATRAYDSLVFRTATAGGVYSVYPAKRPASPLGDEADLKACASEVKRRAGAGAGHLVFLRNLTQPGLIGKDYVAPRGVRVDSPAPVWLVRVLETKTMFYVLVAEKTSAPDALKFAESFSLRQ